ncbi:MAG TPA: P1 family peptidase [Nocardioidaceae bacterium]|nr:P1 family peptidase [Nocardioidaceae bacterium]
MTNRYGAITDVPGVLVGHTERIGDGWLTGVTAVIPPTGTVGAVAVGGGGPGTHQTDVLAPGRFPETVDAVAFAGGSAYGLVAASGLQRWCEEQGRGLAVAPGVVVPIVPAAIVFDLGRTGVPAARPDAEMGYAAAANATDGPIPTGCVGAGTGATFGLPRLKGGIGTASIQLDGDIVVAALVVANSYGSPLDPRTGGLLAAPYIDDDRLRPGTPAAPVQTAEPPSTDRPDVANTTLVAVATNARLDRAQAGRIAAAGHDGLARSIRPVHTMVDGDTVFALATGQADPVGAAPTAWAGAETIGGMVAVETAAADAVTLAMVDAILSATGVDIPTGRVESYLDRYPTARPRES